MSEDTSTDVEPNVEDKSFQDILQSLVGKTVTIVNPQSYEAAPVGFKLTEGFYRAKVTAMGRDYIVLYTEFERKKGAAEPAKQWLPITQIRRVSVLKTECLLHI